jgi:membrane associated rhomboid family serine protease
MIPLKDQNPTSARPIVTIVLIAVCSVVFLFVQPHDGGVQDARFSFEHAAIPCEVVEGRPLAERDVIETVNGTDDSCDHGDEEGGEGTPAFPDKQPWLAVLYSMFLHGSVLHLAGNMLFLWIFGNNIEDTAGKVLYLAFYLASGVMATVAHIAIQASSTIPLVGASGAIAGVMGAYLVVFPNVRIRTAIVLGFFFLLRDVRSKWLLGFWFLSQFFINPGDGVAWMAHVGGFVFGILCGLVWRAIGPDRHVAPAPTWI